MAVERFFSLQPLLPKTARISSPFYKLFYLIVSAKVSAKVSACQLKLIYYEKGHKNVKKFPKLFFDATK